MFKRRQTTAFIPRPSRNVEKIITSINQPDVDITQQATTLYTTTFPATVTGLRWSFCLSAGPSATATGCLYWMIIILRDEDLVNIIGGGDGNPTYQPEQNVLAFGMATVHSTPAATAQFIIDGKSKTSRKMKSGDKVIFIMRTGSTNSHADLSGMVQMFMIN